MPPPRPRILFPSFSQTSRCSNLPPMRRSFTTSTPRLALGPESPKYIHVPKPVQPTFPPKPIVKGVLPVPREVLKARSRRAKVNTTYLEETTKEPTAQKPIPSWRPEAHRLEYKRRLAESRRQALRTGVTALYERKAETEKIMNERSAIRTAEHLALVNAPERESDKLTNPSISASIREYLASKGSPKGRRSPRSVFLRRPAYLAKQRRKASIRKDQLHTLYVNARDFIVSEEKLDEVIDKVFGTDENPVGFAIDGTAEPGARGQSVWVAGTPEGVRDLLDKKIGGDQGDRGYSVAKDRVKKIAEELTGGKM